jgi:glucose-6-phosphate 1-dehydrogenase
MEPPANDGDLHARKLDVLRSVRPGKSRRARYTAGQLADGRAVPAYADEEGVEPARRTETFAEIAFELNSRRWTGTRFVLRTGKALARRRKLVLLRFRPSGELEIGIDGPEDVVLRLPTDKPLELRAKTSEDGLPSYARVLLDIVSDTNVLSVGGDEAEHAWRVVSPVLATWKAGDVPLEEYPAGSAGPS